ncbi:HAD-superfamily hydrolase subfamily IIB [Trichophyton rubrum]|uniref:HAD-superfamily hydrolase subfamily IIB n=1 Tax=Trichophyton rubrum TaxID=5551 RepID=A0A178ET15_TRIRU|nr:HAD-superfamily hydrolase subfamily IIB [Trichophyton rubrum]
MISFVGFDIALSKQQTLLDPLGETLATYSRCNMLQLFPGVTDFGFRKRSLAVFRHEPPIKTLADTHDRHEIADLRKRLRDVSINVGGGRRSRQHTFRSYDHISTENDYPDRQLGLKTVCIKDSNGILAAVAAVIACLSSPGGLNFGKRYGSFASNSDIEVDMDCSMRASALDGHA